MPTDPEKVARAAEVVILHECEKMTLAEYLRLLLKTLWEEEEGFNGKRPFGNSSWKYGVYEGLIKANLVDGILDGNGFVKELDLKAAEELVQAVIERMVCQ